MLELRQRPDRVQKLTDGCVSFLISCPLFCGLTGDQLLSQFNLETPDSDQFKEQLRVYKTISLAPSPPRFELQVLLSIPELTHKQVLVHLGPDGTRTRIDPIPKYILLESWSLIFARTNPSRPSAIATSRSGAEDDESVVDVAPSTIYKHGIPLFRSIFTLLRILPAWKLYKRLRRRSSAGTMARNGNFGIQLRVASAEGESNDVLGFGKNTR